MARWFWAFLAFNIYSIFLLAAFQKNTLYLFDVKIVQEALANNRSLDITEWGWKDHYIWCLFSNVLVTALAAVLAGAIAKTKGGIVAATANIPSVLIWGATFYLMVFGETEIEQQTGFAAVSIVAIPLTTWVAHYFGEMGAEIQASNYPQSTVLGVRPYHWVWIVFPLYLYALGIVFVLVKFLALLLFNGIAVSIVQIIISWLALIPVIVWFAPLGFVYSVLSGDVLSNRSAGVKALINSGVIVGGFVLAYEVQTVCFGLLQKLMSWWYQ